MKRTITIAAAALTVGSLAACGSSGSAARSTGSTSTTQARSTATTTKSPVAATSKSPSPKPTPTVTPTMVSDKFKWSQSICTKLDVNAVAKVVKGLPKKQAELAHSEVGFLTTDNCQFDLVTSSEYGDSASYGLSARTWTVADWAALKRNSLQGDDTMKAVKLGAHGAMVDNNGSGWVLVGNRILTVMGPFKATTAAQATSLLKLAMPKVAAVKPLPALIGLPVCGKANDEAAAVIGGQASVRRDQNIDHGSVVLCAWSVRGGSVSVENRGAFEGATKQVKGEAPRVPKAQTVKGLGTAAVYFPDSGELHVATKDHKISINSSGAHSNKKRLIALAKVLVSDS